VFHSGVPLAARTFLRSAVGKTQKLRRNSDAELYSEDIDILHFRFVSAFRSFLGERERERERTGGRGEQLRLARTRCLLPVFIFFISHIFPLSAIEQLIKVVIMRGFHVLTFEKSLQFYGAFCGRRVWVGKLLKLIRGY